MNEFRAFLTNCNAGNQCPIKAIRANRQKNMRRFWLLNCFTHLQKEIFCSILFFFALSFPVFCTLLFSESEQMELMFCCWIVLESCNWVMFLWKVGKRLCIKSIDGYKIKLICCNLEFIFSVPFQEGNLGA